MNWFEIGQMLSFIGGIFVGAGITIAGAALGIAVWIWRSQ